MKIFYTETTWHRFVLIPTVEINKAFDIRAYHIAFCFLKYCLVIRFGKDSGTLA